MNEKKKSNSLISVNNPVEVTHRDVAVSTDTGIQLNDGQTSHRRSTCIDGSASVLVSHEVSEEIDENLEEAVAYLLADNTFLNAAGFGNDAYLEILLSDKTINVHQLDHLGRNALHLAVCSGNERAVKLLLESGVSPNVEDNVGTTPLSLCLMRKPSLRVANLLFDYGATIMQRSGPMDTGLFIQLVTLCKPTHEEEMLLQLLVQKGALVNDPAAPGGRQPLHIAAMGNNCRLIRMLVELGAEVHAKNHRGQTPMEFAKLFNCKEAMALLEVLEEFNDSSSSSGYVITQDESSTIIDRSQRSGKVTILG